MPMLFGVSSPSSVHSWYLSDLDSAVLAPVDEDGGQVGCDEGVHAARGSGNIRVRIYEKLNALAKYFQLSDQMLM